MRSLYLVIVILFVLGCSDTEEKPSNFSDVPCSPEEPECAEGTTCSMGSGSEFRCLAECEEADDCSEGKACIADDESYRLCDDPRPVCDAEAAESDCECGFNSGAAFRVSGTDQDCEIVERDVDACYGQWATCLNACVDQFFRYDLGDGTALIIRGLQGGITEGWTADGQGLFPMSCPALEGEFEAEL